MQNDHKPSPHSLNPVLLSMDVYASKAISLRAKADPSIANVSFGEPSFGPPEYLLSEIANEDLSLASFLNGVKRYEDPRGSLALRQAIAVWYRERYGLTLDPDREIMVTHGGVEAITLAILATTRTNDEVAVSDPSYQLYARTVQTLERRPRRIPRPAGLHEYVEMLADETLLSGIKAMIINSPENPTGYVASMEDWERIGAVAARTGSWIIHDEVYDVMHFARAHAPARAIASLADSSILVNSFSKKFGMPGLRIGWMVAPPQIIDLAAKAHDYLYLGVNIQYERIAQRLLDDPRKDGWFEAITQDLQRRSVVARSQLGATAGFAWPRQPLGAMFLFPDVWGLYQKLPIGYRAAGVPAGDAVARYLFEERKVAVVPGSVYGKQGDNHVRLVLCTEDAVFDHAIRRMQ
jgi:aspartate/methionine/tyrosine aminotransferase